MFKKNLLVFTLACSGLALLAFNIAEATSEEWVAPAESRDLENPVEMSEESRQKGEELFSYNRCYLCHGEQGKGDGMMARSLKRPPKDLTSSEVQAQVDGELFWKISEGKDPMPARKDALSEEEIWHLVNYVRHLGQQETSQSDQPESSELNN